MGQKVHAGSEENLCKVLVSKIMEINVVAHRKSPGDFIQLFTTPSILAQTLIVKPVEFSLQEARR
jgi:hypothetical protein